MLCRSLAPVLAKEENPPHSQAETPQMDQHTVQRKASPATLQEKSLSVASKIILEFFFL